MNGLEKIASGLPHVVRLVMVEVRGNETELVSVAEVLDLRGVVLWAHDSGVATVG